MSGGGQQAWNLENRSQELLGAANGALPVGSSQYGAGCLRPIPADGMAMGISEACANQVPVPRSSAPVPPQGEPGHGLVRT